MNRLFAILIFLTVPGLLLASGSLQDIQDRYSSYNDFTADFTQDTYQFITKKTIHFTGKVSYLKDQGVRMDVYTPQQQLIILKENLAWIHLPEDGTTTTQEIPKEFASRNVLAFFAGITSLEKDYRVEDHPDCLLLAPRKGAGELRIIVDDKNLIRQIQLEDATGNSSTVRLGNYKFDSGLSPAIFRQEIPAPQAD